ncbi:MAG TPA: penicillin-binding protein activator LpoB [Elusimicrobia bacterium]|nr:MAG: penicillin-binding protein activator LpoB [Elusimicrobia bacterium RIFOXYA12_FULL_49_49]OGS09266.1 MAG: penicillin-binding protein activator LpoB [Elusimicrobia bacterium RIFOXYB1_FULL_48_9]OGS09287.1 MAG: penicillin-binding protein activator LpoB [Elusimicrobia bacterium RIFOXYA1_FULL_47_7]OGS15205.1 MAG: penicillin-binding protein activator LpoB [Elusimicrobia bacterium RIFOXYA2_FULL_47_53]OGS25940.1 MAG: penicillin-binding protein activator LpoB [Elusimicrobia bacterium RIFOXYB12_FUL
MFSLRGLFAALVGLSLVLGLSSCASTPKVSRVASDDVVDLSGDWNDTDSQQVSKEMIGDSLSRPWLPDFVSAKGQKPRVIVGTILNKSHEHISTETFVKDLERELTNSGRLKFVASKEQRQEIRDERMDQAQNATMESAKAAGQEIGADFMLKGQINSIMDEAGKTALKYYQVELELLDMSNNEKVWIGQKKIKKIVERKKVKF